MIHKLQGLWFVVRAEAPKDRKWCSCFQRVGEEPFICEPHRLIADAKIGLVNELEREIILLNSEIAVLANEFFMYRNAWLREIGGMIRNKHHEIDGFVLRTKDVLREARRNGLLQAAEIVNSMQVRASEYTAPYTGVVDHAVKCREAIKVEAEKLKTS